MNSAFGVLCTEVFSVFGGGMGRNNHERILLITVTRNIEKVLMVIITCSLSPFLCRYIKLEIKKATL
jgi:hypothetical protein